jgi:CheY-like chemotaxis protein
MVARDIRAGGEMRPCRVTGGGRAARKISVEKAAEGATGALVAGNCRAYRRIECRDSRPEAQMAQKICKVLVVEDHAGIRDVLGGALDLEGYDFMLIGSDGAVEDALHNGGHDVVVIDLPLAKGDAFTLAAAAQTSGLGVILTSGDQRLFERIETSGHRHIRKPFMLDQFLPLIDSVLRELRIRCVRRRERGRAAAPRRRAGRR